jgi:hypothetical protein
MMTGRPRQDEAAHFFWKYIDKIAGDNPLAALEDQLPRAMEMLQQVSEERSLFRYGPDKWSMREVLSHLTDTERAFSFRALWFGRGFAGALDSFDDNTAAAGAHADRVSWAAHLAEFAQVRAATISLFRNMPDQGCPRTGVAAGDVVSVRALAFICAGHVDHHLTLLRERYWA